MVTLSLTEAQVFTALRSFLLSILPASVEVIQSQQNRVAEPKGADFVLMTPMRRDRLATNSDTYQDAILTGFIVGTTLTATEVAYGSLVIGAPLYGAAEGTAVTAFGTGTGGAGTYTVTPGQTVANKVFYAGTAARRAPTQLTIQLDVHGPSSADNAQIISTLFRSEVACTSFTASGIDAQPLYAGDPRQMPFINEAAQYENRWTLDAVLQINPVVTTPQQFADEVAVGLINVP